MARQLLSMCCECVHFFSLGIKLPLKRRKWGIMDEVEFGAQIRRARLIDDITQEELATRANISRKSLANLESGQGSTLSTLVKVLRALKRDDWLGTLEPEPTVSPLQMAREAAGITAPRRASRRSQ